METRNELSDLDQETTDLYILILSSQNIPFRIDHTDTGSVLIPDDENFERALEAVRQYWVENTIKTNHYQPVFPSFHRTYSGLFMALLLFAIHWWLASGFDRRAVIETFGASASLILRGDWYRCITALLLHGDDLHLIGNMAGIIIFGTSVCSVTGAGMGWFLILLTGFSGNYMNALLYKSFHLSIGASTSVFGAIGILTGYRFTVLVRTLGLRLYSLITIGAGFALLGILGSSEHSDVTAHLFGYLSGLAGGCIYAMLINKPLSERVQTSFLFLSAAIIIISWYSGLPIANNR